MRHDPIFRVLVERFADAAADSDLALAENWAEAAFRRRGAAASIDAGVWQSPQKRRPSDSEGTNDG
jgi:hypothetical protein